MVPSSSAVSPSNRAVLPHGRSLLRMDSPSFAAAIFGALVGLGLIAFTVHLFANTGASLPLAISIGVLGIAQLATSYFVVRVVRVAWAFALSINGTAAVVLLFSAPRIRDALDVSIGLALVPCVVASVIVVLHSLAPEDF